MLKGKLAQPKPECSEFSLNVKVSIYMFKLNLSELFLVEMNADFKMQYHL